MKPVIFRKIVLGLLGGLVMFSLSACGENKNSREWIENKVSEVSRVYPTEDLFDLFEEFPEGFEVDSIEHYKLNRKDYSNRLYITGNPTTKTISGTFKKVLIETDPYRETVVVESDVYYESGTFEFPNLDPSENFIGKEGFLFQRFSMDKTTLSQLDLKKKGYDEITGDASITYTIENPTVNQFLNVPQNSQLELHIGARRATLIDLYYSYALSYTGNNIDYYEGIAGFGGEVNE